jgi:hypothetical protein
MRRSGELDDERRTLARTPLGCEGAAVACDDLPGQRESETEAAVVAVPRYARSGQTAVRRRPGRSRTRRPARRRSPGGDRCPRQSTWMCPPAGCGSGRLSTSAVSTRRNAGSQPATIAGVPGTKRSSTPRERARLWSAVAARAARRREHYGCRLTARATGQAEGTEWLVARKCATTSNGVSSNTLRQSCGQSAAERSHLILAGGVGEAAGCALG